MSECNSWLDELKAYADGELAPARWVALRIHLARCADCRKELEEMDNITASLKADEPNGFDAALRNKLLAHAPESAAVPTPQPTPWRANRRLQLWAAASTLIIVWFVGSAIWPMRQAWDIGAAKMSARREAAPSAVAMGPSSSQDYDDATKSLIVPRPNAAGGSVGTGAVSGGQAQDEELKQRQSQMKVMLEKQAKPSSPSMVSSNDGGRQYADGHAKEFALTPRHVVRAADITVEVQKLEEKSESIERMVKEAGGFIASNQLSTGEENAKSATLSVKVPTEKFDSVLAGIAKLGEVKAKNVTGEDVTEKVSDEAAAAKVLNSEITSKEKAGEAYKVLELRTRVEQVKGRLELLKKLSTLATMTVQLREKPKTAIKSGGFVDEMGDTGRAAVNSFMQAARLPILLLIWVLAYAPVWVPLAIAYRYAAGIHKERVDEKQTREWRDKRAAGTA